MSSLPRMYTEFARFWPLISDPADYENEARYWREAVELCEEALGYGCAFSFS